VKFVKNSIIKNPVQQSVSNLTSILGMLFVQVDILARNEPGKILLICLSPTIVYIIEMRGLQNSNMLF